FPSPDWPGPTRRVAREAAAWRTLVEAGLGSQTANSFVILASDGSAQSIWPHDQIAAFYQNDRRAAFSIQTKVTDRDGRPRFSRQLAEREDGDDAPDRSAPTFASLQLTLKAGRVDYVAGTEMIEILAASTVAEASRLMHLWVDLIDGILSADLEGAPFDALPHNVVITEDGELVLVDSKWEAAGLTRADLMGRCALWTALHLSERATLPRWGDANGEGLALRIGELVGLPGDQPWIAEAIAWEARLQDAVTVRGGALPPGPARVQAIESALWDRLKNSPAAPSPHVLESLPAILASLSAAETKVALLEGSLSWRITKPLRGANAVRRSLIGRKVPPQS
ncbi:MAG: hypothetical protein WBA31_07480, partial [Candidatus Dormiibacterota bacterium]